MWFAHLQSFTHLCKLNQDKVKIVKHALRNAIVVSLQDAQNQRGKAFQIIAGNATTQTPNKKDHAYLYMWFAHLQSFTHLCKLNQDKVKIVKHALRNAIVVSLQDAQNQRGKRFKSSPAKQLLKTPSKKIMHIPYMWFAHLQSFTHLCKLNRDKVKIVKHALRNAIVVSLQDAQNQRGKALQIITSKTTTKTPSKKIMHILTCDLLIYNHLHTCANSTETKWRLSSMHSGTLSLSHCKMLRISGESVFKSSPAMQLLKTPNKRIMHILTCDLLIYTLVKTQPRQSEDCQACTQERYRCLTARCSESAGKSVSNHHRQCNYSNTKQKDHAYPWMWFADLHTCANSTKDKVQNKDSKHQGQTPSKKTMHIFTSDLLIYTLVQTKARQKWRLSQHALRNAIVVSLQDAQNQRGKAFSNNHRAKSTERVMHSPTEWCRLTTMFLIQTMSCSLCDYVCECSDRSPKCIEIIMSCPEGLSSDGTSDSLPRSQDHPTPKTLQVFPCSSHTTHVMQFCVIVCVSALTEVPKCIEIIMSCPEGLSSDGTSDSLPRSQDHPTPKTLQVFSLFKPHNSRYAVCVIICVSALTEVPKCIKIIMSCPWRLIFRRHFRLPSSQSRPPQHQRHCRYFPSFKSHNSRHAVLCDYVCECSDRSPKMHRDNHELSWRLIFRRHFRLSSSQSRPPNTKDIAGIFPVQVTQLTSCSLCDCMCECSDRSPKCIEIIMSCPWRLIFRRHFRLSFLAVKTTQHQRHCRYFPRSSHTTHVMQFVWLCVWVLWQKSQMHRDNHKLPWRLIFRRHFRLSSSQSRPTNTKDIAGISLVQVTQLTSCSLCDYMCECSDRSPKCHRDNHELPWRLIFRTALPTLFLAVKTTQHQRTLQVFPCSSHTTHVMQFVWLYVWVLWQKSPNA